AAAVGARAARTSDAAVEPGGARLAPHGPRHVRDARTRVLGARRVAPLVRDEEGAVGGRRGGCSTLAAAPDQGEEDDSGQGTVDSGQKTVMHGDAVHRPRA